MKTQYTKDKSSRLSFRVNETLRDWVWNKAHTLGVTPCDYARSVLFQQMSAEAVLATIGTKKTVAGIARSAHANK